MSNLAGITWEQFSDLLEKVRTEEGHDPAAFAREFGIADEFIVGAMFDLGFSDAAAMFLGMELGYKLATGQFDKYLNREEATVA